MLTKPVIEKLKSRIFTIESEKDFNDLALDIFRFQWEHNPVYARFVGYLHKGFRPDSISHYRQSPFIPIDLFKTQKISVEGLPVQDYFMSSGTTSQGAVQSRHFLCDISLYEQCFSKAFRYFWGEPSDYVFLALLPNYLEQPHSSLIYMMKGLIAQSGQTESGFYLYDREKLAGKLQDLESQGRKTMLFGVSYALLDMAENCPMPLRHTVILETGGMKGRRKEMPKEELHQILCAAFQIEAVHSEYGMCELLSQAYSAGNGIFRAPAWMKVIIRDINDPFMESAPGERGIIHIIDLANRNSCSFIETEDTGRAWPDGSFTIDGRLQGSERRGCNMLLE